MIVRKKYIVTIFHFLILVFVVFGNNDFMTEYYQIEEYKLHFDKDKILEIYEITTAKPDKTAADYFLLAASAASLSYVVDAIQDRKGEDGTVYALQTIEWAEKGIETYSYSIKSQAELYFILADMYSRLITGASTGMRYNSKRLHNLNNCLEILPDHVAANIMYALNLIYTPSTFGGNPVRGEEVLFHFAEEYPDNMYVLIGLVKYHLHHKDLEKAKSVLVKLLEINPRHIAAKNIMREIELEESASVIVDIVVKGKTKTKAGLINSKTKKFIGKAYSTEIKSRITNTVAEIHSIDNCSIKLEVNEDGLILNLYVSETSILILNPIIGVSLSMDYNREINFFNGEASSYPVFSLTFVDTNLFGLSDEFIIECGGPHLLTEFTHYSFIDFKLYIETLLVTETYMTYDRGHWMSDLTMKSPYYIFSIGVGKSFPFNLSVFLYNILEINDWIAAADYSSPDLIIPEDSLTYTAKLHVLFDNVGIQDNLWILDGFKVEWYPELIYKFDYQLWGLPGEMNEHDDFPGLRLNIMGGYYKDIFNGHNIHLETQFFTGYNLYEREKWTVGRDILSDPFDLGLSGFYPDEFRFQTGWLFNIYYSIPVIPSALRFFLKNDTFINFDTMEIYDGIGIGSMMRFPFDIELTLQLGLGLNAEREEIPGIEFDASLTKIFSF